MVELDIEYKGDLHCEVEHGPSGQKFMTDAPVDNRGKGEAISPTDLAAASIGSCIATIMGMKADDNNIDLKGLKIKVNKEMHPNPKRRIKRITLNITFPKKYSEKELQVLKNVVKNCPVSRSLRDDVEIVPKFSFKE